MEFSGQGSDPSCNLGNVGFLIHCAGQGWNPHLSTRDVTDLVVPQGELLEGIFVILFSIRVLH